MSSQPNPRFSEEVFKALEPLNLPRDILRHSIIPFVTKKVFDHTAAIRTSMQTPVCRFTSNGIYIANYSGGPSYIVNPDASLDDNAAVILSAFPTEFSDKLVSPDGNHILTDSNVEAYIRLYSVTGELVWNLSEAPIGRKAFSPDSRQIAAVGPTSVRIFDAHDGSVRHTLLVHHGPIDSKFIDNRYVAVRAFSDCSNVGWFLWDTADATQSLHPLGVDGNICVSANRLTVAFSDCNTIHIFNARDGRLEPDRIFRPFANDNTHITSVRLTADGKRVFCVAKTRAVAWMGNVVTGACGTFLERPARSQKMAFFNQAVLANDERWLATFGAREKINVWDVETGKLVQSLPHPTPEGYTSKITIAASNDGQRLVTTTAFRRVYYDPDGLLKPRDEFDHTLVRAWKIREEVDVNVFSPDPLDIIPVMAMPPELINYANARRLRRPPTMIPVETKKRLRSGRFV